jgi:hypothetical protein
MLLGNSLLCLFYRVLFYLNTECFKIHDKFSQEQGEVLSLGSCIVTQKGLLEHRWKVDTLFIFLKYTLKYYALGAATQGENDLCSFTDLPLLLLILQLDGGDSLFMEANTLAFVFSKIADSFTQLTCKYFTSHLSNGPIFSTV